VCVAGRESLMSRYVIIKGSSGAGLGDRIFGLSAGLLYAQVTGRTLHVDWRDGAYGAPQENLFPKLLRIHDLPATAGLPATNDVAPAIWQDHLELKLPDLRGIDLQQRGVTWEKGTSPPWNRAEAVARYSIDAGRLDYQEAAVVLWSGDSLHPLVDALRANGRLPNDAKVDDVRRDVVRRHLRLHDDIQSRIDQTVAAQFGDSPTIGVHYRLTNEAAKARSVPTRRQYRAAIDAQLYRDPAARVFLSTDNRDVQQDFAAAYGAERVFWIDKWLPGAGEPIHMNSDCPDGVAAARDALVDAGLLARCTSLVLTGNSAFSQLAGILSATSGADRITLYPDSGSLLRRGARSAIRRLRSATALRRS
jgi:hypothetical protein